MATERVFPVEVRSRINEARFRQQDVVVEIWRHNGLLDRG
jgi:hypothetical protein